MYKLILLRAFVTLIMIACLLIDYAVKPTLFVDIDIAYSHMIKSIM